MRYDTPIGRYGRNFPMFLSKPQLRRYVNMPKTFPFFQLQTGKGKYFRLQISITIKY